MGEPGEVIVFLVMLWFYGFSIVGGIIRLGEEMTATPRIGTECVDHTEIVLTDC